MKRKRKSKKVKISNNLIAVLIIIFGIIMAYNNYLIFKNAKEFQVTGLVTETAELTLTLEAAPSPPPDKEEPSPAPSAAAAGGGGGGSGGVAPESNIIAEKTQVWSNVPSGSSISISVDNTDIAITEITTDINTVVNNAAVTISSLKSNPVSKKASAKVYQYILITKKNIQDTQIDKITITFRVLKTWLNENNLQSTDVSLFRYNNDEWNELTTSVVSSDVTYVNYESDTPGFSYFAIGSRAALGAGFITKPSFNIDKDLIKVILRQEETTTRVFTITNDVNETLELKLNVENLGGYITLSDYDITLEPNEKKLITLDITAPEDIDLYDGKILIKSDLFSKLVNILVEVKSRTALFDILIKLDKQNVKKGDYIEGTIDLINIADRSIDVNLFYSIRDLDGNTISFNEETLKISDKLSIIRKLKVPENIKSGKYIFYVKVTYNGDVAISSDLFNVLEKPFRAIKYESPLIAVFTILIIILIILTIFNLRRYREVKYIIKISELLNKIKYRPKEKAKITKEKLEKELEILKADFKVEIITKSTYNKQKKKIEELIKKEIEKKNKKPKEEQKKLYFPSIKTDKEIKKRNQN